MKNWGLVAWAFALVVSGCCWQGRGSFDQTVLEDEIPAADVNVVVHELPGLLQRTD